jgi:hypothetical protein
LLDSFVLKDFREGHHEEDNEEAVGASKTVGVTARSEGAEDAGSGLMVRPLLVVSMDLDDYMLFTDGRRIARWRGGCGLLFQRLRAAWVRDGKGRTFPVDDREVALKMVEHATCTTHTGTWQGFLRKWVKQFPTITPGQQGLLDDILSR